MDKLQLRAVIAGICFGLYPLFLSRSKLTPNLACAAFTFTTFLCVLPFALGEMRNLVSAYWTMLILGAILSGAGMLTMTSYLAKATPVSVGLLIILMLIAQAAVTAAYQMVMDRGVSLTKCLGFAFATVAIVLLNKK
jgi:hypothetical protein